MGGASPYTFVSIFFRRKIAGVLCGSYFMLWDRKSGAEFFLLRHRFDFAFSLFFFYCFSAPLSRLAPIEALSADILLASLVGAFTLQRKLCSLDFEQICRSAHSKRYSCCNNDKVALLQIAKLHRTLQSVSDEFVSVCFLFDNACSDTP